MTSDAISTAIIDVTGAAPEASAVYYTLHVIGGDGRRAEAAKWTEGSPPTWDEIADVAAMQPGCRRMQLAAFGKVNGKSKRLRLRTFAPPVVDGELVDAPPDPAALAIGDLSAAMTRALEAQTAQTGMIMERAAAIMAQNEKQSTRLQEFVIGVLEHERKVAELHRIEAVGATRELADAEGIAALLKAELDVQTEAQGVGRLLLETLIEKPETLGKVLGEALGVAERAKMLVAARKES